MRYTDHLDLEALKRYAATLNRRAHENKAPERITAHDLRSIILESGGKCGWCTCSLLKQAFEIDHIIPLTRQGSNHVDNLALTCPDCNRRKSGKHPAQFAQEIYAQTGQFTALIQRVLAHYDMETPRQQLSLFDQSSETPQASIDTLPDDHDDITPYIWSSPE